MWFKNYPRKFFLFKGVFSVQRWIVTTDFTAVQYCWEINAV
jgi:hypothetical protein